MGLTIFVVVIIVIFIIGVLNKTARLKAAETSYRDSLQKLKRDPNNPDLREMTLERGRKYSNMARDNKGHTIFDEMALMNDINAACARATLGHNSVGKVEVTNVRQMGGKSASQEIEKLGKLFLGGIITAEEFERGKSLFLGTPPDKAEEAIELLQNLNVLKVNGVLSQSEFNMKKWEILSERLLPGRLQAASLKQRKSAPPLVAVASAPVSPMAPPQPASNITENVPCPSCGKDIPLKHIQIGKNYCPTCGKMFEAE